MSKALLHELGQSISFGRLSLKAKVLWPMLLAASDHQGRGLADPDVVKWLICPNVREIEVEDVPALLDEMVAQEMLLLYEDGRSRALYQVLRWWDYQELKFAVPSKYDPPEGWLDRVKYRKGGQYVERNWAHPGGFTKQLPLPSGDGLHEGSHEVPHEGTDEALNQTKLNQTKPTPPPTPPSGGGGGGDFSLWEHVYHENCGLVLPAARGQIEALFDDPEVDLTLWQEAIGIAVANNQPKLAYVLGVIRRRLGRNGDGADLRGPPAGQGGEVRRLTGSLPAREERRADGHED